LDDQEFDFWQGQSIFRFSKRPERFWNPSRPVQWTPVIPDPGVNSPIVELNTDIHRMQRLRIKWSHLFTRPVCLHAEHKENITMSCLHICMHYFYLFTFFLNLYVTLYRSYSSLLLSHLVQQFHWYLANAVLVRVQLHATDTLYGLRVWRMPYLRRLEECGYNSSASPHASADEMDSTFPHTDKRISLVSNSMLVSSFSEILALKNHIYRKVFNVACFEI
jgi:hypothetical protein